MLPLLLACAKPCPEGTEPWQDGLCYPSDDLPDAVDPLRFDGLEQARWDGGDGLALSWRRARPAAGVRYLATLETLDGGVLDQAEVTGLAATFDGLAEGVYALRVVATDPAGQSAGGEVRLVQRVGSRIVLRGELPLRGAMDVWGEGDVAVLAGGLNPEVDVLVADVSNPDAPRVLSTLTGLGHTRDVELHDGLLFTAHDCQCTPADPAWADWDQVGARIFDLADPTNPRLLAEIGSPDESVHRLSVGGGLLLLVSNLEQQIAVYDIADPTRPRRVGAWAPAQPGAVHDAAWVDGVVTASWGDGFSLLDLSDPANPVEAASLRLDRSTSPAMHNAWPSADASVVFTSEEKVGGHLRAWDVRDPAAVVEIGAYEVPEADRDIHNVHIHGELAFAAWYTEGLVVLDVSDPTTPRLVERYDTWAGEEGPIDHTHDSGDPDPPHTSGPVPRIQGAWGVWPFGERVLVGDTERGLLVFDVWPEAARAE